jgi:hypothetical protein
MRLLQVIVDQPGAQAAAGASSNCQASKQAIQQQQQQQQPSCEPAGRAASSDVLAEQLVHAARAAAQQQRWQQLQHSLKAAAASGSGSSSNAAEASQQQQDVHASLAQLQGLVKKGCWPEVEGLVEELQPGLLQETPRLRFELKRCQFMQVGLRISCDIYGSCGWVGCGRGLAMWRNSRCMRCICGSGSCWTLHWFVGMCLPFQ